MSELKDTIAGCARNDHKFQKVLYKQYYGYALKTVFRYIYKYETAVDVVNDGFVKLFRSFDRFKAEDEENIEKMLMGWIRRVMINNAIDELRRTNMIPEIGAMPDHVWQETDKAHNADQLMLYKELISQVKKLPPMYRSVFNMYVIDGLNHYEIADTLGIAVGTSKSNLWKARNLLQKFIKGQEEKEVCNM